MPTINRYPPVNFKGKRPEDAGIHRLRKLMHERGWHTIKSHGSAFQVGVPDLLCWHKSYGFRMIEVKTRTGTLTPGQKEQFGKITAAGGMVWVIVVDYPPDDNQLLGQLEILHGKHNWFMWLAK